jgi:hypothetical protein
MNSHVALYLAEVHHAELRSSAARARAAATASTPSWTDRFRAAAVRWQHRPVASTTLAGPAGSRASAIL